MSSQAAASAAAALGGGQPLHQDAQEVQQPALRVMRLYKPKLWTDARGGLPGEFRTTSALVLPDSFGKIYRGQVFTAYVSVINPEIGEKKLRDVAVSAKLQAPSAKRAIELVDVSGDRRAAAERRGAYTEPPERWIEDAVQSKPSRRKMNPAALVEPGDNVDMIVEHTLSEAGTHTLRVSVAYTEEGQSKNVRKFYRFTVAEPVTVNTRAYLLPPSYVRSEESPVALVEARVENLTHDVFALDNVSLQPPPGYAAREVKATDTDNENPQPQHYYKLACEQAHPDVGIHDVERDDFPGKLVSMPCLDDVPVTDADLYELMTWNPVAEFDRQVVLTPNEVQSFVFGIHRVSSAATFRLVDETEIEAPPPANAGWLKVGWTGPMGELGQIVTAHISWEPPFFEESSFVRLDSLPQNVGVGQCFECSCCVSNPTESELVLQLQWRIDEMPRGIKIRGLAHRNLGRLAPKASVTLTLSFRATEPGFQPLTGCRLLDLETQREFPMPTLGHVLVTNEALLNIRQFFKTPDLGKSYRSEPSPFSIVFDPNTATASVMDALVANLKTESSLRIKDVTDSVHESETSPAPAGPVPGSSDPYVRRTVVDDDPLAFIV